MTKRELINQERYEFESRDILIVEGFSFNQKQTISRICNEKRILPND